MVLVSSWLDRWYAESARWLVLNRRSEDALKSLYRVARINGKPEVKAQLTIEVRHLSVLYVQQFVFQLEANLTPCDCRCSTLTWARRLSRVIQRLQHLTFWRPEEYDESPSVCLLSGQKPFYLSAFCSPSFIVFKDLCFFNTFKRVFI